MNSKPMNRDHTILTITNPAGAVETEFLTEDEAQALAQFVKQLGWSEFSRNAKNDDETYLIKRVLDKLQDMLKLSGYEPH